MNDYSTIIVGLTGGVGSGKSTAELFCKKLGVNTADADKIAHDILDNNCDVISNISDFFVKHHNTNVLQKNGKLNRQKIANFAFQNLQTLSFLENLIHPIVKQHALKWIDYQRKTNEKIAILIVPLLFESEFDKIVDVTAAIAADPLVRKNRLLKSKNWSVEHIEHRMKNQLSETERNNRADFIIDNNGSIESFEQNFNAFIKKLENLTNN